MCRPVEKSCLVKFQDLFDALKDVLCPPADEDDTKQQESVPSQQLPGGAGVESLQEQRQRTAHLLLLYSQCLSSFVWCFSNVLKEERERERGERSLPTTHILQILL